MADDSCLALLSQSACTAVVRLWFRIPVTSGGGTRFRPIVAAGDARQTEAIHGNYRSIPEVNATDDARIESRPRRLEPLFRTQVKNVLLTGASAGIGKAIAELLTDKGHQIWGTSRSVARLPGLPNLHPVELDLNRPESIRSGVALALEESQGIDVLINNAGSGIFGSLEHVGDDGMREQFQTLVFGPMEIVRLLLPHMRNRNRGLIINVTSLAAQFPIPYMGAYSAAKAALSTLSWSLEMELCQDCVRVVDLQPGDIHTEFHRTMQRHPSLDKAGSSDNITRAYRAYSANMERAPSPARVARSVLAIIERDADPPSRLVEGGTFQSRIAPLLARVSPLAWIRFVLRRYYGLKRRDS